MMATLATTAAPKFSGVGEGAKEKKTLSDIDKIITASNNFYNDRVSQDGRGRFPGPARRAPIQISIRADDGLVWHQFPTPDPSGTARVG